jgi:hypothetical protein
MGVKRPMKKEVEVRHYNRRGKAVRPKDSQGLYVLKIVWNLVGNDLRRTDKSGWLKAAPEKKIDFETWDELWTWVNLIQKQWPSPKRPRGSPKTSQSRRD